MKKLLLLIVFLSPILILAQNKKMHRPFEKIEKWERVKLIELLDLNEEISVRFFARKNEHNKKMKEILDQRFEILTQLEKSIRNSDGNDKYYQDQIDALLNIEKRISIEREIFFKSLSDLLNKEQTAKLLIFDNKLKREIRNVIIDRGEEHSKDKN